MATPPGLSSVVVYFVHGMLLSRRGFSSSLSGDDGSPVRARDQTLDVFQRPDHSTFPGSQRKVAGGLNLRTHRASGKLRVEGIRCVHLLDALLIRLSPVAEHTGHIGSDDQQVRVDTHGEFG